MCLVRGAEAAVFAQAVPLAVVLLLAVGMRVLSGLPAWPRTVLYYLCDTVRASFNGLGGKGGGGYHIASSVQ